MPSKIGRKRPMLTPCGGLAVEVNLEPHNRAGFRRSVFLRRQVAIPVKSSMVMLIFRLFGKTQAISLREHSALNPDILAPRTAGIPVAYIPAGSTPDTGANTAADSPRRLRFLSYNIQIGIATSRYRQYLTHSWKHVLPSTQRLGNLDRIARPVRGSDIVGLQEVDAGSLRSRYTNQTEYFAMQGD